LGSLGKAADDQEAAVAGKVADAPVMGGYGPKFAETPGVFRGQFVKGTVDVEQVALGTDFAAHASAAQRSRLIERRVTTRQSPAPTLGVHVERSPVMKGNERLGQCHRLGGPGQPGRIIGLLQTQISVKVIAPQVSPDIPRQETQGLEVGPACVQQTTTHLGISRLSDAIKDGGSSGAAIVLSASVEKCGRPDRVALGGKPHPGAGFCRRETNEGGRLRRNSSVAQR